MLRPARGERNGSLSGHDQQFIELIGARDPAVEAALVRGGFVPGPSAVAAVVDLRSGSPASLLATARARCATVVALLPPGASSDDETLDGFVRDPADLPAVLRGALRSQRDRLELMRQGEDLAALLDVTSALAAGGEPTSLLFRISTRLASRLNVERCSVVLTEPDGGGVVIAASDDPGVNEKRIDLVNYPEIREVLITGRPLVIEDARTHALLDPVRAQLEGQTITAIAVVPMVSEGVVAGVLFVRAREKTGFSPREVSFLSTVASAAAVSLRNAGRIQSEKAQRAAAERELLQLRRYEEIFSHVTDGMTVLDAQGKVMVLNPSGCAILGIQPDQARGLAISELVAPETSMEAALVFRELQRGGRILSADLRVRTRDGRRITLSVSAGSLRSPAGRAILTFRDVTESRELEAELRKTKEFLERLIDATVDGIVAADLRGRVLLFNKGAERVTGFSANEVVGKINVPDLYDEGQATALMGKLRAARDQGDGRIGPVRVDLVAKNGEIVPVELSVAMVAEGGNETATVGVFRDLREELRIEGELQQARERLAVAEKAAVVSALAGAAAHELNQPLTSVMGFSELLLRRTQEHEKGREELATILREADRMVQIVRRIGRITHYETTPYVGKTRIVDLDRSSDPPPVVVVKD